jgi:hypothetical protein
MVKVFALIPQRPDIPREEFHEHWLSPHGELACGIDTLQGYVQCHRIRPGIVGLEEADYEGIAEVWFVDVATAAAMGENPVYAEQVNPDEPNFIDVDRLAFVFTDENVLRAGSAIDKEQPVVKAQLLVRRGEGTSREDFDAALADADGAAGEAFPGALRIVRSQARAESYAEGEPAANAFIEAWWSDREAFEADWSAGGEGYLAALAETAGVDSTSGFLSEEVRLLWPVKS